MAKLQGAPVFFIGLSLPQHHPITTTFITYFKILKRQKSTIEEVTALHFSTSQNVSLSAHTHTHTHTHTLRPQDGLEQEGS